MCFPYLTCKQTVHLSYPLAVRVWKTGWQVSSVDTCQPVFSPLALGSQDSCIPLADIPRSQNPAPLHSTTWIRPMTAP
jgi:hypothetical protein